MARTSLLLVMVVGLGLFMGCGDDEKDDDGGQGGSSGTTSTGTGGSSTGSGGAGGAVDNTGGASDGAGGEGASTGGSSSSSAGGSGGDPSVPDPDVHGKVVYNGAPIANLAVVVGGVITSTDDDGEFSVPDVADAYDLILFNADDTLAQVVQGLTTRSPVVEFTEYVPDFSGYNTASISGTLSGAAGFPNPASRRAQVAFARNARTEHLSTLLNEGQGGNYTMSPSWPGAATKDGTLWGLQWAWDSEGLTEFTGYASKPFSLADGGVYTSTATDLALGEPDQHTLDVTVDWGDYTPATCTLLVGSIKAEFQPCDDDFSLPTLEGLPIRQVLSLRGGGAHYATLQVEVPATGDLDLVLPEPSLPLLPLDGAPDVDEGTTFSFSTSATNMVGVHTFICGSWRVRLMSGETSVNIPDLSDYGMPLPNGASCTWLLNAVGPASTVDELVELEYAFHTKAPLPRYESTDTPARTFTTAN